MFTSRTINSKLDAEILSALEELESQKDDPTKYDATVKRISNLKELKTRTGLKPPSLDTVLVVGANIFGILWLARYEREEVIKAPQAMKFVMKPR